MGRFDVLTQLDKKPVPTTPLPVKSEPVLSSAPPEDQFASKPANMQTDLHANMQTRKFASLQADKDVSLHTSKTVSMQTSKQVNKQTRLPVSPQAGSYAIVEKFSSYLTPACKRGLQRIAFESERKDYEVLIEAVEQYLARQKLPK